MKLLSRREYNLILRSLDKYELYMNSKEKQLSEELQDKLYYNLYNPKDGIAQTKVDVSALYDIKQRKIYLTKLLELLANCGGLRRSHHQQLHLLINN